MLSAEVESYLTRLTPNPAFAQLFRHYGLRYRWYAVLTIVTGNFAAVLSGTIINVAIPDIMGTFGIGQQDAQWLSTANLAASTVSMLASSWMVRSLGLRATVSIAMLLFLCGSMLGGLAPNTNLMIASRIMQGLTAGILTPVSMSIIFQVFPPGKQGRAMGISAIGVILAPAIGPAVGGVLIDAFNWRFVFFLGIPFSLLTLFLASLFMPRRQNLPPLRFDWLGLLLMTIAITSLLIGLSNGQREGWGSDFILECFAIALVCGAAFVYVEIGNPHAVLDLGLFANSNFLIMSIIGCVFGAGLFASTYLVPLFLQMVQRLTPTDAGALMIPGGVVMIFLFPIAGRFADRVDHRFLISGGICFFALAFWLMSSADRSTAFWTFAFWIMLSRVGIGLVMPALQMGAMRGIEPSRLTQASGSFNFLRQLGGAFGVNLMSVTLEHQRAFHADYLLSTQTWGNHDTMDLLRGLSYLAHQLGFSGVDEWNASRAFLQLLINQQALVAGFKDSFMILMLAFLVTLLPTWMLQKTAKS